jgi:DNA-binding Lrp family transcriptional regulator
MIDEIDQQIIQLTQTGLPLVSKPYHAIAEQLDISADEVMARMQAMQDNGIIRRIGAIPNHYKLGYTFNGMTVWDVADEMIETLGQQVGGLDFVSHCYHRPRHLPEWSYNLFAMVHGKTQASVDAEIAQIRALLGEHCRAHTVLYSTRILKKTGLRIKR